MKYRFVVVDSVNMEEDVYEEEFETVGQLKEHVYDEYGDKDVNGKKIKVDVGGCVVEGDVWFMKCEKIS